MARYSIKDLERLSGIKAHTIRIWEKRYHLVTPSRTATNIRFYSDEDLKKIINIALLNGRGMKISKISLLSEENIRDKVLEISESRGEEAVHINQMVVCMVDLDEDGFDRLLSKLSLKFGLERTMTEIVYPFLERIGVLWQTGNITPAQEHFISNLIRQKVIVAIDALPIPGLASKSAVLFLPETELHEIGLLFCYYILKKAGIKVYYLGQAVPYDNLKQVVETHQPDCLVTMFVSDQPRGFIQDYIERLSSDFPQKMILASGSAINRIAFTFPRNFRLYDRALKMKELII